MSNSPGTTPAPTKSLAQCSKPCWSERASQLGETHHLDISSMECVVTVHHLVMSEPIMQGWHSPFLGDIALAHSVCPGSAVALAHASGVTAMPLPTPSLVSCLAVSIGVSCQSLRCLLCLPRPHRVSVSVVHTSRHIWQVGSFDNNPCLTWRLKDKVPQALATLKHGCPALWAPLVPPMGEIKASTWLFCRDFLPSFFPSQGSKG